MSFRVTSVESTRFAEGSEWTRLRELGGVTVPILEEVLAGFSSETPVQQGVGHQQILAKELEGHFERSLSEHGLDRVSPFVSPRLGERVDFAMGRAGDPPYLLGEIEFRPNFEKDLVKFKIAANRGVLAVGVLVVAKDRREINPRYTSMPQYDKVIHTVAEFEPSFPLLVMGFSGSLN